jgi:hypothetical protein
MTETDNDKDARIKELEKQIAELKAVVKVVELRTQPPPKVPTAPPLQGISVTERIAIDRMSVPKHVLDAMAAAVGDDVIRQIATEDRKR